MEKKKNHVLIVDDDNYTIELYKMMIQWSDHKNFITTEISAAKALEELADLNENHSERFPRYILLDLRMPEMHGFEFIEKFGQQFPERKTSTSFIIATSSVIESDKEKSKDFEQVKEFQVKPIPDDYIEKLVMNGI